QSLLDSDVLLGTSAGSAVAAQIAGGATLDDLFARQLSEAEGANEIHPGVSIEGITEMFMNAMLSPGASKEEKLQKIGTVAATTE
ncbi:patatin, partial [Mycobacterium sp. ITM-2017-0098]